MKNIAKILCFVLSLVLVFSVIGVSTFAEEVTGLSGSGTEADPYLIQSVEDLVFFRDSVNEGETKYNAAGVYVQLAADIDLASYDWSVNIGDDCNATFDGIFDGAGHTIYNLTSVESAQKGDGYICTGLFGAIYGSAVIKNLTLENVNISTGEFTGNNVAALVGFVYAGKGSIENVIVCGDINIAAPGAYGVGAIIGYTYSSKLAVTDCIVAGNEGSYIKAASGAAAIAGYADGVHVNGAEVSGLDISAKAIVAGITGTTLYSSVENVTVSDLSLTATGDCWGNSAAVVSGSIVLNGMKISGVEFENVTANGEDIHNIAGSQYVEQPTEVVPGIAASLNDVYYFSLQDAIDAANDGDTVVLANNCAQDVTVVRAPDFDLTIDGNGFTLSGSITVNGKSATYATGSLTIKNVNFDATNISADASINLGGNNSMRYVTNVVVENCSFTGEGNAKVGIKSYTGGDKNITITDCSATDMHSLAQVKNVTGITVSGCQVEGKNGVALGKSSNIEVSDCEMTLSGYGLRFDASVAGTSATVSDCDIEAFIPVVVREATADYNLTFEGTNTMTATNEDNIWCAIGEKEYGDDGVTVDDLNTPDNVDIKVEIKDEALQGGGVSSAVVSINGVCYPSLQDAVNAAKPGDVIQIHNDSALEEAVTVANGYRLVEMLKDGKVVAYGYAVSSSAPEIIDGKWVIGGFDTGIIAEPTVEVKYVDAKEGYYWFINGVDTNVKAEGDNGSVPTISAQLNGNGKYNWYINGKDTGVLAKGVDGLTIVSVTYKESVGNIDVYEILFSDGITATFNVINGNKGQTGDKGPQGPQGPQGVVGPQGTPGADGNDNNKNVVIAIAAATVCAVLAISVVGYRGVKRRSWWSTK